MHFCIVVVVFYIKNSKSAKLRDKIINYRISNYFQILCFSFFSLVIFYYASSSSSSSFFL